MTDSLSEGEPHIIRELRSCALRLDPTCLEMCGGERAFLCRREAVGRERLSDTAGSSSFPTARDLRLQGDDNVHREHLCAAGLSGYLPTEDEQRRTKRGAHARSAHCEREPGIRAEVSAGKGAHTAFSSRDPRDTQSLTRCPLKTENASGGCREK